MDGMHDLGGRQGFGRVVKAGHTDGFHDSWEVKINALSGRLVGKRFYNMDEYRHAIERMVPQHYISASYYERVFTAVATLCVEKGAMTYEQLREAAGEEVPLSLASQAGRVHSEPLPALHIGDWVRVKDEFFGGHIRMPGYVRGKTGQIVGQSPEYPFPDASAHGLQSAKQCTFDVRFDSQDLWGKDTEPNEVHVGLFHAYLIKVER